MIDMDELKHSDLIYQELYFYQKHDHKRIVTIGFMDDKPWELYISRKNKHPIAGDFAELYAIPVLSNGTKCPFPIQSIKRPGDADYTVKHLHKLDGINIKLVIEETYKLKLSRPQHAERFDAQIKELQVLLQKYETS